VPRYLGAEMFPDPESCDPSLWNLDTMSPYEQAGGGAVPKDGAATKPKKTNVGMKAFTSESETRLPAKWEEEERELSSSDVHVVVDWPTDVEIEPGNDTPWFSPSATSMDPESAQIQLAPGEEDLRLDGYVAAGMFEQDGDLDLSEGAAGPSTTMDLLALDMELDERWGSGSSGSGRRGSKRGARGSHRGQSDGSGTATPPPPQVVEPDPTEQQPDESLNSDSLFSDRNFKKGTSGLSERGRGAFAAAAICLLERLKPAAGHVHAIRGGAHVDRWQLNRMPGRTDALLHFVNAVLVSMLGLKAFSSWRALARSLGDTRDYLPPRHWRCLELKGGGVSDATKQPWQSYRARAGHFDRLAEELESFLLTCGDLLSQQKSEKQEAHQEKQGQPQQQPQPPQQDQSRSAARTRQEQFAAKRVAVLTAAPPQAGDSSGGTARESPCDGFKTKAELLVALEKTWSEVLLLLPTISPSPSSSRRKIVPSAAANAAAAAAAAAARKANGAGEGAGAGVGSTVSATSGSYGAGAATVKLEPSDIQPTPTSVRGATTAAVTTPEAQAAAAAAEVAAAEVKAAEAAAAAAAAAVPVKSRSGRAVTVPKWMKGDGAFVTGKVMNDVFHQAGKSKAKVGQPAKKRRRRGGVSAAAAVAMFG
jgi:hypothetical protein